MKTLPLVIQCAALVFLSGYDAALQAEQPLIEFNFNTPDFRYADGANTGSGSLSTGSLAMKLGFRNAYGGGPPRGDGQALFTPTSTFYTLDMGGVSGFSGDYALQIDTAPGDMGNLDETAANNQSAAIAEKVDPALEGLTEFTITGWFFVRGDAPLGNFARILSNHGDGGIELRNGGPVDGRLELRVNGSSAIAQEDRFIAIGEWVFVAASYDSSSSGSEVRFFAGGKTNTTEQIGADVSMAAGAVQAGKRLTIGNAAEGGERSFSGAFDSIRIYDVALDLPGIELVRLGDLAPPVNFPLPPSSLQVTAQGSSSVFLEWRDNSTDEAGFEIIRVEGETETRITLPPDTTEYLDNGLTPETQVSYSVISFIPEGALSPTETVEVTIPPLVTALGGVEALQLLERSPTAVSLGWADVVEGEAGFAVESFSEGSRSWVLLKTLPAGTEIAVFENLMSGAIYRYRVYAFNGDVVSEPAQITFQTPDRELALGGTGAAEIDESLLTRTLYVDPEQGSDFNNGTTPGTAKSTIMAALALAGQYNQAGEGTRVILQPGVYMEGEAEGDLFSQGMIEIGAAAFGEPAMPIVIEGAGWDADYANGDVIVSGSRRYTEWKDLGDGVFEHGWTIDWTPDGPDTIAPEILRSFHLVNVRAQGEDRWQMYFHVEGPDDPNVANLGESDGYFWVDQEADWIRVKAPAGVNLDDPGLEVNVNERHRLLHFFQTTGSASTKAYTPLVLRNIVFRHGFRGPYFQNSAGVIVEDCRFENSKGVGFTYESPLPGFTIRRCEFIGNGISGGGSGAEGQSMNALWENLVFEGNARHAYVSDYRGWAESGIKFGNVQDVTFRDFIMRGNYGTGLWLDTGLKNFEVYSGHISGGVTGGVFVENNNRNTIPDLGNQMTVYLRDLIIKDGITDNTKGVQFAESENVIVDHVWAEGVYKPFNIAYNNRGAMAEITIKNSVAVQAENLSIYFQGDIDTWREVFDTILPAFDGNRYYGGTSFPFLNRDAQPVDFTGWVRAINNNPAHIVDGAESESLHDVESGNARPTLGIYPVRRTLAEGDELSHGFLVSRLGPDLSTPVTVDIAYSSGVGYATTEDFVGLTDSVTIPEGSISVYVPLSISTDGVQEGPELLEAQVLEQGEFEVLTEPARILINDADAQGLPVFFVQPLGDRLFENTTNTVEVRVLREGILAGPVSLEWESLPGALAGEDYLVQPSSFTFEPDEYEKIIQILPLPDALLEGPELLTIELKQASGGSIVLAAPAHLSIPINDNDGWVAESLEIQVSLDDSATESNSFSISNPTASSVEVVVDWPLYQLEAEGSEQSGGPDPDAFIDIQQSGAAAAWQWWFPNDDGFTSAIELPWPFNWFGEAISTVYAHSNGFVVFGEPASLNNRFANPVLLPVNSSLSLPNQLAVAWANLKLDGSSALYHGQIGDKFIVQWNDFLLGQERVTFQLQFEEDNTVTAYYRDFPKDAEVFAAYQNGSKDRGTSFLGGSALPGIPYAIQFKASIPAIGSEVNSVVIDSGKSTDIPFFLLPEALAPGSNSILLPLRVDTGKDFDQRLPVKIEYGADPIARFFGDGILQRVDDWISHERLGWLNVGDWPFVFSYDLGWIYTLGSLPQPYWYALEWDSGWFYMPPDWYPYAFFLKSQSITGKWGYLLPTVDDVWIYVIGEDWISIPKN